MGEPTFWDDTEKAQKINQELNDVKISVDKYKALCKKFEDMQVLWEMAMEEEDDSLEAEVNSEMQAIRGALNELELEVLATTGIPAFQVYAVPRNPSVTWVEGNANAAGDESVPPTPLSDAATWSHRRWLSVSPQGPWASAGGDRDPTSLRNVTVKGVETPVELRYGAFITAVINFLIVGFALFLVVKAANRMQTLRKKEEESEEAVATELELLTEIRDLLANNSKSQS